MKCKLDPGAYWPKRAHDEDAGYDLKTPYDFTVHRDQESVIIDTGVHFQIPKGYVGFLMSKSGINVHLGATGTGVIDSGYTGSIVCKLYFNEKHETLKFKAGDKIIQIVFLPIYTPDLELVSEFDSDSERGDNGFGSTGR